MSQVSMSLLDALLRTILDWHINSKDKVVDMKFVGKDTVQDLTKHIRLSALE